MKILRALIPVAMLACATTQTAMAADAALIEAAKKEGEVVWYTSLIANQAARPIAAAFEREYPGIKVRITPGTSNDLALKLLAEHKAGSPRADVSHAGSNMASLLEAGVIAQYESPEAKRYPAALKDPKGFWTAQVTSYLVAAINTDLVKPADEPRTMNDLLLPKWTNKIAWAAQMTQGGPPGYIGTMMKHLGPEKGIEFLTRLSKQRIINVPANQRVVLDQVISGQYPIALATFSHHSELSKKKGAPVKWLKLDPVTGTSDPTFLIKSAPHPNAGKLFIDFLLSKKGQEAFRDADYIPADPTVPASIPGLKPEQGGFKAVFLSLPEVHGGMKYWIRIYNEKFK